VSDIVLVQSYTFFLNPNTRIHVYLYLREEKKYLSLIFLPLALSVTAHRSLIFFQRDVDFCSYGLVWLFLSHVDWMGLEKIVKDFDLFGIETHPILPNPHGLRAKRTSPT
jgi:hypothetical protein